MKKTTAVSLLLLFTLALRPAGAEEEWIFQRVKSFGEPTLGATSPASGVIVGSDGKLYGTTFAASVGGGGVVYRIDKNGGGFLVLHSFTNFPDTLYGAGPIAALLEASDGRLYGTTLGGGSNDAGTVFSLNHDGTGFEVLHHFLADPEDGAGPTGELIEARDGRLYGTTREGGSFGNGVVFRLDKNGNAYEVLHAFDGNAGEGAFPQSALLEASDGGLFGTTSDTLSEKETVGAGKIFRMNSDGSDFQVLHDFGANADDGQLLLWGLTESDGWLYGTTDHGGARLGGTIFRLRPDGSHFRTLHSFTVKRHEPSGPFGPLLRGTNGPLYGVTRYGGSQLGGTVFAMTPAGAVTVVQTFGRTGDGVLPVGALVSDGTAFYGVTIAGGRSGAGSIFKFTLPGFHQTIWSFSNSGGDAANPSSPLALAADASVYGTTSHGGATGAGTIFNVAFDGTYRVVFDFTDPRLGTSPDGVAVDPADGMLYATAAGGGGFGGTLVRVSPNGRRFKVLHVFGKLPGDGRSPAAPLLASDGSLYGATTTGGAAGAGTIYRIDPDGRNYQVLHAFNTLDGATPETRLIEDTNGALIGTCRSGGTNDAGVVFRVNKDGSNFAVVHAFAPANGGTPSGPLLLANDGRLYGIGEAGSSGGTDYAGTIFRMDPDGNNFEVIYTFPSFEKPIGGLIEDGGALWGMDQGDAGGAEIFRVGKDGSGFTLIHGVDTIANSGSRPPAGLVRLPDGSFRGVTTEGGDMNLGIVFRLRRTGVVVITPVP